MLLPHEGGKEKIAVSLVILIGLFIHNVLVVI